MNWLSRLWESLTGTEPVETPKASDPPQDPAKESFAFSEAVGAVLGPPAGQVSPRPGELVVQLYDADGELLVLERLKVAPLPKGPYLARGKVASTFVVVPFGPTERSHQEFTLDKADADFREPLFQRDFAYAKFWWSCDSA